MSDFILALAAAIESATWADDTVTPLAELSEPLRALMTDQGSLTSSLKVLSNDNFKVNVIRESLAIPYQSEIDKLGLERKSLATIREVELHIFDTPVVYARSIIPTDLTERSETGLAKLGSKPLGHLLFKDGRMRQSRREFACVNDVYGRRTPYEYEGGTILVNEFFLGSLNNYL